METGFTEIQPLVAYLATHLGEDLSLPALAAKAGFSPFHLHRIFSARMGETPKQLALRLRLSRAATLLLTSGSPVLDIALCCGFRSHEVFCRAFRRGFGLTPSAYRERGFANKVEAPQAREHAVIVEKIGPCVGLYHRRSKGRYAMSNPVYIVVKKELAPQPVLVARRRIPRSEIAATIAEVLPQVFLFAQQNGLALSGLPFTRYPEVGPGMLTIEPGMRILASGQDETFENSVPGDIVLETLPGGPAATTTHAGPYEGLTEAYAAIERWMQAEGYRSGGAPWESYLNDPGEYPDPKDWKTEVVWPLARD